MIGPFDAPGEGPRSAALWLARATTGPTHAGSHRPASSRPTTTTRPSGRATAPTSSSCAAAATPASNTPSSGCAPTEPACASSHPGNSTQTSPTSHTQRRDRRRTSSCSRNAWAGRTGAEHRHRPSHLPDPLRVHAQDPLPHRQPTGRSDQLDQPRMGARRLPHRPRRVDLSAAGGPADRLALRHLHHGPARPGSAARVTRPRMEHAAELGRPAGRVDRWETVTVRRGRRCPVARSAATSRSCITSRFPLVLDAGARSDASDTRVTRLRAWSGITGWRFESSSAHGESPA